MWRHRPGIESLTTRDAGPPAHWVMGALNEPVETAPGTQQGFYKEEPVLDNRDSPGHGPGAQWVFVSVSSENVQLLRGPSALCTYPSFPSMCLFRT